MSCGLNIPTSNIEIDGQSAPEDSLWMMSDDSTSATRGLDIVENYLPSSRRRSPSDGDSDGDNDTRSGSINTVLYPPSLHAQPTTALTISRTSTPTSLQSASVKNNGDAESLLEDVLSDDWRDNGQQEHIQSPEFQPPDIPDDDEMSEHLEASDIDTFLHKPKQFFVFSAAGKPIFSYHGDEDAYTGYMGVLQAIVAFFSVENRSDNAPSINTLRTFETGSAIFVVQVEYPLILTAVSRIGESEQLLRAQLDMIYIQILSTLTKAQISRAFKQRENFDLRRLLTGSEIFLRVLARDMASGSLPVVLNSLECLRLKRRYRSNVSHALMKGRCPSLLYGIVVADFRLVDIIRPKRHSLHPPDLYILFSMLFNVTTFQDEGEHWVPICLPKFNSQGFLYAYIHIFRRRIALILISAKKEAFFDLQSSKTTIIQSLNDTDTILSLELAAGKERPTCRDMGAPLFRHFIYKSRPKVQYCMPSYNPYYPSEDDQKRLKNIYQRLHTILHSKGVGAKGFYLQNEKFTALSWSTNYYELYCISGPGIQRAAMAKNAAAVLSWIRREEQRLFITEGAVSANILSGLSDQTNHLTSPDYVGLLINRQYPI